MCRVLLDVCEQSPNLDAVRTAGTAVGLAAGVEPGIVIRDRYRRKTCSWTVLQDAK
jgi:hypothetical protein